MCQGATNAFVQQGNSRTQVDMGDEQAAFQRLSGACSSVLSLALNTRLDAALQVGTWHCTAGSFRLASTVSLGELKALGKTAHLIVRPLGCLPVPVQTV
jgi:hypothetical protein